MTKDCFSCAHSVPAMEPGGQIDFTKKVCVADPPQVVALMTPKGPQFVSAFPQVTRGVFCHRHEEKPEEAAEEKPQ